MTQNTIPDTVKELVRELDPIIGYDVYLCDCGSTEDCPPELIEVNISSLYDNYGLTHDEVLESPWGDEIERLWETMGRLSNAPQVVQVMQFEMVKPVMANQGVLWVVPDEQ